MERWPDRFYDDPGIEVSKCGDCIHYRGFIDELLRCDAYPDGIPREVLNKTFEKEPLQCSPLITFEKKSEN